MDLNLSGKTAVVTGASKGIGLAVARTLAGEGCNLELVARGMPDLEGAAAELRAAFPAVTVAIHAADMSLAADQERIAHDCRHADILVNNAGSNPGGDLLHTTDAVWRKSWDLKVFGYINLTRSMLEVMKDRGEGVIVNIIGLAGERVRSKYIIGTASNAALMAFTRSVGSQSPDFGVRVVGINPGYTATDRAEFVLRTIAADNLGDAERWREAAGDLPFGRMGEPQEVADAVAFLASPRAAYISGTILTVDGGAANRNG